MGNNATKYFKLPFCAEKDFKLSQMTMCNDVVIIKGCMEESATFIFSLVPVLDIYTEK